MKEFVYTAAGVKHLATGTPCHDSFSVLRKGGPETPTIAMAFVADGMGSCLRAEEAAEAASRRGLAALEGAIGSEPFARKKRPGERMRPAFEAALSALRELSEEQGAPLPQYGTTLSAYIFERETGHLTWGSVGDSGIMAFLESGEAVMASTPRKGPESHSQTYPLSDAASWEFGSLEGVAAVLVATDGVLERLYQIDDFGRPEANGLCLRLFEMACEEDFDEGFSEVMKEALDGAESGRGPFAGIADDRTLVVHLREAVCQDVAHKRVASKNDSTGVNTDVGCFTGEEANRIGRTKEVGARFLCFLGGTLFGAALMAAYACG